MVATVVMHPMDPIVIGLSGTPACEHIHLVARVALRRPLVQSHGRPSRPQPPNAETPNITVQYACSNSQSRHLCSAIPEAASSSLRAFSGSNQTAQFRQSDTPREQQVSDTSPGLVRTSDSAIFGYHLRPGVTRTFMEEKGFWHSLETQSARGQTPTVNSEMRIFTIAANAAFPSSFFQLP
jgi:hypothetical protein